MLVDSKRFNAGLKTAQSQLVGFRAHITQTSGALSGLFAGAVAASVVAGAGKIIVAASDVAEATNMVQAQFGAGADLIIARSNQMAAAFGVSKKAFLESSGQFGGMFEGAGFANKQVAEMSNQVMDLAINARSLKNVRLEEATLKLAAGLSGEAEPLRRWGINLIEANVNAKALAMGLTTVGEKLTDQQKITARLQLITEGLRAAEGDRARTAGSLSNLMDEMSGRTLNLADQMGKVLEPAAQSAFSQINTGLTALSMAFEDNQAAILAWAMGATTGAANTTTSMGFLQIAIGKIADVINTLMLGYKALQSVATFFIASQLLGFNSLLKALDQWTLGMFRFEQTIGSFTKTWESDLGRLAKRQMEDFKDALSKPVPSEAINDYFKLAAAKNKALQAEILATAGKSAAAAIKLASSMGATEQAQLARDISGGGWGTLGIKKKGKGEHKFASVAAVGSSEAVNAVLKSKYGSDMNRQGNEIKAVARNTTEANQYLKTIADKMSGLLVTTPYELIDSI